MVKRQACCALNCQHDNFESHSKEKTNSQASLGLFDQIVEGEYLEGLAPSDVVR